MIPTPSHLTTCCIITGFIFHFMSVWFLFCVFVFLFFINLFIYFWLHWVFAAARGLSLVAASGGCSSLR